MKQFRVPGEADLLRRLGRRAEAADAYQAALARADNQTEQAFLRQRLESLRPGRP